MLPSKNIKDTISDIREEVMEYNKKRGEKRKKDTLYSIRDDVKKYNDKQKL